MIEVIGIPGSGKSTLIRRLSNFDTMSEVSELSFPLIEKSIIKKRTILFRVASNLKLLFFCTRYWKVFCSDEHKQYYQKILKRCFKIFTIIIICREYNLATKKHTVQEGVLHLMHELPDDINLFFKRLLSVYCVSKISIIFLKVDLLKSMENHSIRENINFKKKEIQKYSKSLILLQKLYDFIVSNKSDSKMFCLNKFFFLLNNKNSSVKRIYKKLKKLS